MVHNISSSPTPKQKAKYTNALSTMSDVAGGIPNGITPEPWETLTSLSEPEEMQELREAIRGFLLL